VVLARIYARLVSQLGKLILSDYLVIVGWLCFLGWAICVELALKFDAIAWSYDPDETPSVPLLKVLFTRPLTS
jgi:hypothetical protein